MCVCTHEPYRLPIECECIVYVCVRTPAIGSLLECECVVSPWVTIEAIYVTTCSLRNDIKSLLPTPVFAWYHETVHFYDLSSLLQTLAAAFPTTAELLTGSFLRH
jgi:hypothetical protein